ncbi:hypothetical protein ACVMFA_007433 [Bradyrhizobium liaoningense]
MPYSLAIFDLDGTLADSFPWFLRTINDVADRFNFRRVKDEDIEELRHASSREILARLEVPLWKLPAIARHARRLKAEAAAEIALFAGVEAMLRTLAENGVQLALVTSDSEANAREKLGEAAALFAHSTARHRCSASPRNSAGLSGAQASSPKVSSRSATRSATSRRRGPRELPAGPYAGAMRRRRRCGRWGRIMCSSGWMRLRRR